LGREAGHSPPPLQYVFMGWYVVKYSDNFIFYELREDSKHKDMMLQDT